MEAWCRINCPLFNDVTGGCVTNSFFWSFVREFFEAVLIVLFMIIFSYCKRRYHQRYSDTTNETNDGIEMAADATAIAEDNGIFSIGNDSSINSGRSSSLKILRV